MSILLKTLFDIILIRRGPEDLPHSTVLFFIVVGLWLTAFGTAFVVFDWLGPRELAIATSASILSLLAYQLVLLLVGRVERSLQTQTALIGCGSLISILFVLLLLIGGLFEQEIRQVFSITAELLSLWSVPVKGHIISRAADLHWYAGIAIAAIVFILQFVFNAAFATPQ